MLPNFSALSNLLLPLPIPFSYLRRYILNSQYNLNHIDTESGIAALHYASGLEQQDRSVEACQLLIDLGANVNICTFYDKVTPLHIAVENNYADVLELLLVHGGDLEAKNVEGDTPIALAIDNKNHIVIDKIVEHVKRKKQNSRLEALKASEALLTPTKRGTLPNASQIVSSPYYVQVKRVSHKFVLQEVIEISDESSSSSSSSSDDETQYFTPVERSAVNLFELTTVNLEQFTRSNRVRNVQRRSLVSRWCDNIRRSDRPVTMIDNLKRLKMLFTGYDDDTTIQEDSAVEETAQDEVAETNQVVVEVEEEEQVVVDKNVCDNEMPHEFIDLCIQDDEEGDPTSDNITPGIPEIIITSPDQSMDSSIPQEIRQMFPTSDLSRSPPDYQLWSEEEEDERVRQAVEEAELPVVEISESNASQDDELLEEEEMTPEKQTGKQKSKDTSIDHDESAFDESNFIRSPKPVDDDSIEQLVEEYEHRDIECGLKFFELKLVANNRFSSSSVNTIINMVGKDGGDKGRAAREGSPNSTMSSIISTAISVPLDYDTDALRDELKSFGCNPGPITTTTKRLYLRRLFRYKKDPRRVVANQFDSAVQCK